MSKASFVLVGLLVLVGSCAAPSGDGKSEQGGLSGAATNFVGADWRPARASKGHWVILLPGASGLKVFDDDTHYQRAAASYNAMGLDAIVLDYKAAYRAATNPPKGTTGKKIAWVVGETLAWARREGKIAQGSTGAIVAWSLGAEGLWTIVGNESTTRELGVEAAAAYYPSNEEEVAVRSFVPLLILTGEKDDVTEIGVIRRSIVSTDASLVELRVYPQAQHGFDIESLTQPRTVSLIPLIGPTATFAYDQTAAEDAARRLAEFLGKKLRLE